MRTKEFDYEKGKGIPFGVYIERDGSVQFSISMPGTSELILHIYKRGQKKPVISVCMDKRYKVGSVFSVRIPLKYGERYEYCYEKDGKLLIDPYTRLLCGKNKWGERRSEDELRGSFFVSSSPEEPKEKAYIHEMEDLIIYRLHVRGFTKHRSSKVSARGTFLGLMEKIPYIRELGVNAVELMPCYEFDECMEEMVDGRFDKRLPESVRYPQKELGIPETKGNKEPGAGKKISAPKEKAGKVNYWGYTGKAYYFAPKASYASEPSKADLEFKQMVDCFHENGIEVFMDMYFDGNVLLGMVSQCLQYWSSEYGIDGFHLSNNEGNIDQIVRDPLLSNLRIFRSHWEIPVGEATLEGKHLGTYHDGFLYDIRRFLKGDEGQVESFVYQMRSNPKDFAKVNYFANSNGFTLMDSVSYDWKHNEENGEDGQDGPSCNASWNCGVEGSTRKRQVLAIRRRLMKNAFLMLLSAQGIPLILAGDEFGNSQKGNNNAYCQDNEISWLNWNDLEKQKELHQFVKRMIAFRKEKRLLHKKEMFRGQDYLNCGCPDFSVHGTHAWYPDKRAFIRVVAFLYCGAYEKNTQDLYIAYNMHWEPHEFDLPKSLQMTEWKRIFDTSKTEEELGEMERTDLKRTILLEPRSAVILEAEPPKKKATREKKKAARPVSRKMDSPRA